MAHAQPVALVAGRARDRNPARRARFIQDLLPAGVTAAELAAAGDPALLLPDERRGLTRASHKRMREFAAGRLCARRALEEFGIEDFALAMGDHHCPRWPRGMVGSITHCGDYAAAVAARGVRFAGLGLDAEVVGGVTADLWAELFVPAERAWLETLEPGDRAGGAALLFSAKESFYKCQFTLTRQWLEFGDVRVDVTAWMPETGVFTVRPVGAVRLFDDRRRVASGRFAFRDGRVYTAMALAAGPDAALN